MQASINNFLLLVGVLSIIGPLDKWLVDASSGWRRPKSWTYNVRRSHINKQTTIQSQNNNSYDMLRSSLFGVANQLLDLQHRRRRYLASIVASSIRGGDNNDSDEIDDNISQKSLDESNTQQQKVVSNNKDDDDDERYSRQMYALGARAHKLVRSTTAILDGPLGVISTEKDKSSEVPSGLLYELAKNLALSGVGRIVLVQHDSSSDDEEEAYYFDGSLDDLGAAYHRAAIAEIGEGSIDVSTLANNNGATLLAEYIQRLNPGVQVDIITRNTLIELLLHNNANVDKQKIIVEDDEGGFDIEGNDIDISDDEKESISLGTNPVVVCVDRSISSQLTMNDACRGGGTSTVPFISVETAGVYTKLFCDFGSNFVVVDEDGETPRSTLLEGVEEQDAEDHESIYTVKCLEDERHDVSKGDVIEFQSENSDSDEHPMMMGNNSNKITLPKCQVVSVKSPTCFDVKKWHGGESDSTQSDESSSSMNLLLEGKARSFSRVKIPKQVSFSSLREILQPNGDDITSADCCNDDTFFAPSDLDKSFDPLRRRAVMTSMSALDEYVKKYGRLPSRSTRSMERFKSLLSKDVDDSLTNNKQWQLLITHFVRTCKAKFTPVQAISGALGAQEVLKAATGLYNPVKQFLLYDCDEVLQGSEEEQSNEEEAPSTGQSYILGEQISNKLATSQIFLVGAGAIGCELLKNLAAMGAGTGVSNTKRGCLILTDMDTIEKSNLSRQLLFRDHDVGEFKSVAARAAMMRFSPDCRVEAHTSRVGEEEDGPFDDDFWSSGCNVVLNALDNVEARLFVDSQCVTHGLGLIDAGTLGPKGNVQVVIPHESESYGSSADPPEPDIPVCTLKNFPYEISHTIQWAKDLFDGYFQRRPRQANDHVEEMALTEELTAFGQQLIEKLGEDAAVGMAEELGEDLGVFPFIVGNADSSDPEYVAAVKKVALDWAMQQANKLFFIAMDELIQKHPVDSVDDDGAPFWTGARKMPRPLKFIPLDSEEDAVSAQQVIINERIAQFVSAVARLRMESFLPTLEDDSTVSLISAEEALHALQEHAKLIAEKQKPKAVLHNLSGGGSDSDETLSLILDNLNGAKTGASFLPRLNLADFEKDNESNGHVAFVTAASNLRAMAYGIPPADAMETRRVAGRIVPAMITTTGLVSALSCLELVKLLKGLPLTMHRNAFVNLALPFFAFTAPMPCEEIMGVNGKTHSIWDRISIKGSSSTPASTMTLTKFLKKVQKKTGCGDEVEISSISYGPYMIYANFLHSDDEKLLKTAVLEIVRDAVISEDEDDMAALFADDEEHVEEEDKKVEAMLTADQKKTLSKLDQKRFIDFSVVVEDNETGEEFEMPPVRLIKDKATPQQTDIEDDMEQYDIE